MKRSLLSSILMIVAMTAMAIPAKRIKSTITLADGTKVEVVSKGDEYLHYLQAEDGRCFKFDSNHVPQQIDIESLQAKANERRQISNARRTLRGVRRKAEWGAVSNPISGSKKGLVILVNFSDVKMSHTQSEFNNVYNKEDYTDNGFYGSVHDYFYDNSYGQFDLTFDVVGPFTVSKTMSYYGSNDSNGDDKYPGTMVGEAVKLADSSVNYKDYDWDGDGEVDQVYVVYAGYAESQYDEDDASGYARIWPHECSLSELKTYYSDGPGALTLDGVKVDTYACSSELTGTSGTKIDGIGTACHEFSHCMCIPDMYDTSYSAFGMGSWDLMDYGSYSGDGYCPASYTSYERMYCGWLTPTELTCASRIKDMPAITQQPVAYMIKNGGNENEYYLLENHQYDGWDQEAYGHGLLVLHVDYDKDSWINNEVNTSYSHQRMTIIPADGVLELSTSSLPGDPYPGTKKNTSLTDSSSPAATVYTANTSGKKLMGHPITSITESDGLISFDVDGGIVVPVPEVPTSVTGSSSSFTATWQAVEEADHYQLQINEKLPQTVDPSQSLILEQDFASFKTGTSDGSNDLSASIASYTNQTGWSGSKLYTTADGGVKIGSGHSTGYISTPTINNSSDTITVMIKCRKYGSDTGVLNVYHSSTTVGSITPQSTETTTVYQIAASTKASVKLMTSSKRAYLTYIAVYDGAFTEDEIANGLSINRTLVDVQGTSYTVTGLNAANTYTYNVRAVTEEQSSAWSDEVAVDMTDAISQIKADTNCGSGIFYDLMGRSVVNPTKGIYILDGKKVLIK